MHENSQSAEKIMSAIEADPRGDVISRLRTPSPVWEAQFALEDRPHLVVIVDAEEEFDWNASFSRSSISTRSIRYQSAAHKILNRFNIVPTYAVDCPVASQAEAYGPLRELLQE